MTNKGYKISSVGYRIFLLLASLIFILLKSNSSTGTAYIPTTFYLLVGLPIFSFMLFSLYLDINVQKTKAKSALRWSSLIFLLLALVVQGSIIYESIGNSVIPDILKVIVFAFLLVTITIFVGVLKRKV
jgi:hypothetical protein